MRLNSKFEKESDFLNPPGLTVDEARLAHQTMRKWGLSKVFGSQNVSQAESDPLELKPSAPPLQAIRKLSESSLPKSLMSAEKTTASTFSPRVRSSKCS